MNDEAERKLDEIDAEEAKADFLPQSVSYCVAINCERTIPYGYQRSVRRYSIRSEIRDKILFIIIQVRLITVVLYPREE